MLLFIHKNSEQLITSTLLYSKMLLFRWLLYIFFWHNVWHSWTNNCGDYPVILNTR